MTKEQAATLIAKDPHNKDVLFSYLNGEDLNTNPDQSPSRWVINFFDWPEDKARTYPDCFEIVERLVKPERKKLDESKSFTNKNRKRNWWRYASDAISLYKTVSSVQLSDSLIVTALEEPKESIKQIEFLALVTDLRVFVDTFMEVEWYLPLSYWKKD